MPCLDKSQDTTPHSMPQNDDGHIHRASPIRGLPPERLFNNITMASQPTNNRKHKAPTSLNEQQETHALDNTAASTPGGSGPEHDTWGHPLQPKQPNTLRILLQNIGGIDIHKQGSVKLAALQEFMEEQHVDATAITECNVAWNQVDPALWPQEQTKFWWENAHWSVTHNRVDPKVAKYQPGGTCVLVVNQLSY